MVNYVSDTGIKTDFVPLNVFATTLVCTTICTLKCRNCLIKIPYQEKKHTDFEIVKQSLESYFELVNHVSEFTIMGGEAFLYPQFAELVRFMDQYSKRIDKLFFITQATYIPPQSAVAALSATRCNCIVHIDDYGMLSVKLNEVLETLQVHNLQFDVRHYNEDEQYCGGWVDVVGEFAFQNYEDNGLDVYQRCKNRTDCKFIWDGVLYSCGMHGAGVKLGRVPAVEGDALSLLEEIPLSKKRDIVAQMGTRPVEGCKYCLGWDVDKSPRIKAAVQLGDVIGGSI